VAQADVLRICATSSFVEDFRAECAARRSIFRAALGSGGLSPAKAGAPAKRFIRHAELFEVVEPINAKGWAAAELRTALHGESGRH